MSKYTPGQHVQYFPMVRSTVGVDAIYLGSEGGRAKLQRIDMENPTVVNPDYIAPADSGDVESLHKHQCHICKRWFSSDEGFQNHQDFGMCSPHQGGEK